MENNELNLEDDNIVFLEQSLLADNDINHLAQINAVFCHSGPTGLINSGNMRMVMTYCRVTFMDEYPIDETDNAHLLVWYEALEQDQWDSGGCFFSPHKVVLK